MHPVSNKRNAASRKRVHTKSLVQSTAILSQLPDITPTPFTPPEPPFTPPPEMAPDNDSEAGQDRMTDPFFEEYSPKSSERTARLPLVDRPPSPPAPTMIAPQQPPRSTTLDPSQLLAGPSEPGHVRSPVLAREPTTLESFSRMVRNYMPSSIPIPSAAPTPPRVSRPVSFGSFLTPSRMTSRVADRGSSPMEASDRKRRGSDLHNRLSWPDQRNMDDDDHQGVFDLDEELREESPNQRAFLSRYPGLSDGDDIVWAGWDTLTDVESSNSRVLLIGYRTGLQIWDCSSLGSVSELLNLTGTQWGAVELARVLPPPRGSDVDDNFKQQRPLIGIISRDTESRFVVYSLRTHEVVHRITIPSLISFASSPEFIVLSTSHPSASLRILSSRTFKCRHTLTSASLVTFTRPTSRTNTPASPDRREDAGLVPRYTLPEDPRPVFALSGRFLAYCSVPPRPDVPVSPPSRYPQVGSRTSSVAEGPLRKGLTMTQADLGNAAVKIGGSVLSGMKSLGGLAFSAAKAGVNAAVSGEFGVSGVPSTISSPSAPTTHNPYTHNAHVHAHPQAHASPRLFSRSAPEAGAREPDTRGPGAALKDGGASPGWEPSSHISAPSPPSSGSRALSLLDPSGSVNLTGIDGNSGSYITVMDLAPLGSSSAFGKVASILSPPSPLQSQTLTPIAEFLVEKGQPVCDLRFSSDGVQLVASPRDGQNVRVFQLRPMSKTMRWLESKKSEAESGGSGSGVRKEGKRDGSRGLGVGKVGVMGEASYGSPWHMYDLRRGRTSGVIQQVECAQDGRWIGVGTKKGTIHVFAVNPYGGPPDERSHIEGRVVNMTRVVSASLIIRTEQVAHRPCSLDQQPLSTEVSPVTRIRALKSLGPERSPAPVAFTFAQSPLPSSLLPLSSPTSFSGPSSLHSTHSPPTPTRRLDQVTNYQDVLVFTPNDGILSLHRIFVDAERRSQDHTPSTSTPSATSGSLPGPGLSSMARLASSSSPRTASALTRTLEKPAGLTAHDTTVATWMLRRGRDWKEVKRSVHPKSRSVSREGASKSSYLSQAELSTFPRSPGVLPRSVYLTHQFSFHTFGEDYHALLRSHRLDLPVSKVEVRKEVEISSYASGLGNEFDVQSSSHGTSRNRNSISTSFDEGLASAISAELKHVSPSPPVIPMFPNGTPGSLTRSGRSSIPSIPIRNVAANIGDGMSEGLGRLRREITKVRSPRMLPSKGDSSMIIPIPLEFDEEDEDFLASDIPPAEDFMHMGGKGGIGASVDSAVSVEGVRGGIVASPPLSSDPSGSSEASSLPPLSVGTPHVGHEEDLLHGWDVEDLQTVGEDREPFYDISAAGLMDEDQKI